MQIVDKIFFDPITKGLKFFSKGGVGDVGSTKYQIKVLPANLSASSADNANLRVTGLKVGQKYRLSANLSASITGASGSQYVEMGFVCNSIDIMDLLFEHPYGNGNQRNGRAGSSVIFVAGASTLICNIAIAGTASIYGNGAGYTSQTFVMVEELPDHQLVGAF